MIRPSAVRFFLRYTKLSFLLLVLLSFAGAVFAQRGSAHLAVHSSSMHIATARSMPAHPMLARPMIIRLPVNPAPSRVIVTHSSSAQALSSNSSFNSSDLDSDDNDNLFAATPLTLSQLLNPTPGLGFDFSNLAATNRDLAVRAFIDPVTQQELALSERLLQETPSVPISFPFFGAASEPFVMLGQQQVPQVIVLQQPAQPSPRVIEGAPAPVPSPAASAQQPLPDVADFILVLRDGAQIHAVAFTRQGGRLVYITKDGIRQSFAFADLDVTATERLNDGRGTPLRLPL